MFHLKKIIRYSVFNIICNFWGYAHATDITIITEDFPGETGKISQNKMGGIAGEIVTRALEEKKITYTILWTPWKRAQTLIRENEDKKSFIIPLTRNKEREENYNWTAKLYNEETAFFTLRGDKKINSLKEADGKKIGALLGSSLEAKLFSVKNVIPKSEILSAPFQQRNFIKLQNKDIQAIYSTIIGGFETIRTQKMDENQFETGMVIDSEENYIATPKNTPIELINKVKNAIEDFEKTPEYALIIKKYTGK